MKKALIAMSGGVDSSVAALITKEMGYECVGATMKLYSSEDGDAAKIAAGLDMPHHVFDFSENFKQEVIDRFVNAYVKGCTPNPCVDCNSFLKFGKLFDQMKAMGMSKLVTGHYAQIDYDVDISRYLLKRAANKEKDQSYFLYTLTQEQLAGILFPLGKMSKAETRKKAEEFGLVNSDKKESQDICFVDKDGYANFIEEYTGENYPKGNFVDMNGRVLGEHNGLIRYTVGQRKGLGIALGYPAYVCEIRPQSNEVVLAKDDSLYSDSVKIKDVNFISIPMLRDPLKCEVMIRFNARPVSATLLPPSESVDIYRIEFENPVRAAARGQAAVFYDGDIVIGGGTII